MMARLLEVLFESAALPQDGLDVLLGGREGNLVDELSGVGGGGALSPAQNLLSAGVVAG